MKYLFFDCEFASCKDGKEKICEFGYVVVDENFKELYKGNMIINPNIPANEWDYFALKKILTRKKEVYESKYIFPVFYERIAALIKGSDYVFGHSVSSDVHAVNCECERYGLPLLNYEFYDIKEMYKEYNATKSAVSVENIMSDLGIEGDNNKHDAGADAYNTMLELKTMVERLEITVQELIEICPKSKDFISDGKIDSKVRCEQHRIERHKAMMEGDYSDGTNEMFILKRHSNKKTFLQFIDNVQPTAPGKNIFQGKNISISLNYEGTHFKEMMNLVQIIKNEGGTYVLKGSESDIFVTYEAYHEDGTPRFCSRLKYVDIAIGEGKPIKKVTLDEFLSILGITNDELEAMPLPSIDCLFREDAIIKDKKRK